MPPSRPDAEAEARKEAGVGIGLADDLRSIRTALVKAHLADDFGAAFDLMLFQMGRAVFTPGYHDHALDIAVRETPDRPPLRANDDAFAGASPGEAILADRSHLSFDWLAMEDDGEAFAALCALPEADKQRLFAACVSRTVKGQLAFEAGARPETEATVARLDIDFAAHVRPTADMFWSRVRKDRMLAVAREVLGVEWTHTHRKDKKATLASAMETAFAKSDGVPLAVTKEGHAAALAWAPPGFAAFDTGRIDDGEDAAADTSTPPADQAQADTRGEPATEPANGTDDVASAEAPPAAPSAPTETPPAHLRGGEHRVPGHRPAPRRSPRRSVGDRRHERRSHRRRRPQGNRQHREPRGRRDRQGISGRRSARAGRFRQRPRQRRRRPLGGSRLPAPLVTAASNRPDHTPPVFHRRGAFRFLLMGDHHEQSLRIPGLDPGGASMTAPSTGLRDFSMERSPARSSS